MNKLAKNTKDNERKISAMHIKGKIELSNVYYSYPTTPDQVILKDISFTVYPGQQLALVGYFRSGKNTIIQLLTNFYDVEDGKGEILIIVMLQVIIIEEQKKDISLTVEHKETKKMLFKSGYEF